MKHDPVYQDPINCVFSEESQLALKKFNCGQKNTVEELQTRGRKLSKDELESMYAKPMKKMKKEYSGQGSQHKVEVAVDNKLKGEAGLYAEIMEHINRGKQVEDTSNVHSVHMVPKQNRDYATIDECLPTMPNTGDSALPPQVRETSAENNTANIVTSCPKFTTLSKAKKRTVMAASTEKIYETYLSYGKKTEIEKFKKDTKFSNLSSFKPLSQRCKSQPDVFTGDSLRAFDVDMDQDSEWSDSAKPVTFSSFKPAVNNDDKQSCASENADTMKNFHENVPDCKLPGTPIIVATPSFDSLCSVTSHSSSSGSPESVPGKAVSGSSESLSSQGNASEVTSSSLSLSPGYQSVIPVQRKEPLSDHSMEPMSLKSKEPILVQSSVAMSQENIEATVTSKSDMQSDTVNNTSSASQVIGKGNAVKNGIDLSVYLLKPKETAKNSADVEVNGKTEEGSNVEGKVKRKQSVLMFKDSLSGVKTKLSQATTGNKQDRRQTVAECKPHSQPKSVHTPSIGIAAKARTNARHRDNVADKKEVGGKREFAELETDVQSYLETDIDNIVTGTPGLPLKKSKSLGRFETGASTYVTDIW